MDLGDSEAKSKKSLESYFTAMDENPVDQNSSELSDSSTDPVLSADEVSLLLRNGPPSSRSSSSVPKNQMAHGSGALKLMSLSSEWTLKHPDKAVLISSDSANDASPVDCKRPCNLSQSSSSRAMLNFPPTIVGDVIIPYTLLEICGAINSDRKQDLFTPSVLRPIYKTIKKRCLQWMHVGGDLQSAVQEEYTIARIPTKFFRYFKSCLGIYTQNVLKHLFLKHVLLDFQVLWESLRHDFACFDRCYECNRGTA